MPKSVFPVSSLDPSVKTRMLFISFSTLMSFLSGMFVVKFLVWMFDGRIRSSVVSLRSVLIIDFNRESIFSWFVRYVMPALGV